MTSDITPDALYSAIFQDLSTYLGSSPFGGPGATLDEFRSDALCKSLLKKFKDGVSTKADELAINKFLSVNSEVKSWQPCWSSYEDELIGSLRFELYRFFEPLCSLGFQDILDLGYPGPGASAGVKGTDPFTKLFEGPVTYSSPTILAHYKYWACGSSHYSFAESYRDNNYGSTHIEYSKLACVPKTVEISRTICSEPSLTMLFQLGLGKHIERRLKAFYGIDLADQQVVNRALARVGSLPFGPRFATIDLESASDRNSLEMIRYFLPKEIVRLLELYRSRMTRLPNSSFVELNMLSSMGNGFTFPLMTALFCASVSAVYRSLGFEPIGRGPHTNFAVFGDDIIVYPETVVRLKRLLAVLGHKVNTEKSFETGPFRESCGADWFDGQPVRGVYCRSLCYSKFTVYPSQPT